MIRLCKKGEIALIYQIINDAARAYKGVIPEDRYHEPYMSIDELNREMTDGVVFWGYEDDGELIGVMGIQDKGDVCLIRHAYVRTVLRQKGIGSQLFTQLLTLTDKPFLIGTWADASWAIRFYNKHGYIVVLEDEKVQLLSMYWNVPERQIATSVVLADHRYTSSRLY